MSASPAAASLSAQNPWPGLASFAEEDQDYFRGRGRESDELARLVRRERLSVLFGRSGLGKSSLLAAGLAPRLRDDQHLPVLLRIDYRAGLAPRLQVLQALAAEAARRRVGADPPRDDETLWAYFHRAGAGFWNERNRPLLPVLVFDQFEELFTQGQADAAARARAAAFVAELADLVEDRMPLALQQALEHDPQQAEAYDGGRRGCKILLSFREDYLAQIEGLRAVMPSVMRNRFRLLPMDLAQARAVVGSGGDLVAPEVVPRLLGLAWNNKAEAPPEDGRPLEFDPALLSVICAELNRLRLAAGELHIDLSRLETSGAGILGNFYDRTIAGVGAALKQFVEDELVTPTGVRDSRALDDALARPGVSDADVRRLVDGRLLRMDDRFGAQRLELTHDVLTGVIAERRRTRRAQAAEAAAAEREREMLERQRRMRRRERLVWAGSAAALALIATAIVAGKSAVDEYRTAHAEKQQARQRLLEAEGREAAAAQAMRKLEEVVRERTMLAEGAEAQASQAQSLALRAAAAARQQTELAREREREALATDLVVAARTTSPDQLALRLLLGAEAARRYPERLDGQVELLARLIASRRMQRLLDLGRDVMASAASEDGREILALTEGDQLVLVQADPLAEIGRWKLTLPYLNRVLLAARARVALVAGQDYAYLVRPEPGRPVDPQLLGQRFFSRLGLSADGRLAFKLVGRGEAELWSTAPGAQQAPLHAVSFGAAFEAVCASFEFRPGSLAVGDADATWLVETASGRVERRPLAHKALARSADCRQTLWLRDAAGSPRAVVHVDATEDRVLGVVRELRPGEGRRQVTARFVAGGALAVGRMDDEVELWPVAVAGAVRPSTLAQAPRIVATGGEGRMLAVLRDAAVLELSPALEPMRTVRFALPQRPLALVAAASGASLVSVGESGLLQSIRLADDGVLRQDGRPVQAQQIEFNAAGTHLGLSDRGLKMWDIASLQPLALAEDYSTIEFSADGRAYAGLARDGAKTPIIVVVELPSGRELDRFALAPQDHVEALVLRAGGDMLAAAVKGELVLRDIRRKRSTRSPLDARAGVARLAFVPDRGAIAAAFEDGSLGLYALSDGQERWRQRPEPGVIGDMAYSVTSTPDGALLVAGRSDGEVALHDASTGQLITVLKPPGQRRQYRQVSDVSLVGERRQIIAAGEIDGSKHLFDLRRRAWLGELGGDIGGGGDLKAVAVSPGGRRLALRHADNTVSLKAWDPPSLIREACTMAGRNLNCGEWRARFHDEPYRLTCDSLPAPRPACAAGGR